jgi:hypothetical protein
MKLKKGFVLRDVAGEKIVSAEGLEQMDFNKLITLNPTAAYLWEEVYGSEFDEDRLTDLLTDRYDIDREAALADVRQLLKDWTEIGVTEE